MPFIEIKPEEIFFDPQVQTLCVSKSYTCPNYNHSHSCPPKAPYMENEVGTYKKFFLVYSQYNIANYIKKEKEIHPNYGENRIKYEFYKYHYPRGLLFKEMNKFVKNNTESYDKILKLYAGTCTVCKNDTEGGCNFDSGDPCRYPDKKRYSMEAVGIEVIKTVMNIKNKDFEYPSKTFVYTFGLVCLK